MDSKQIRNIAIIAHVDHGKTTLIDHLLKQTHTFTDHELKMTQTNILDSNDLERERGVTILSKNTAITWRNYKINILDTPGHADFSGEVERVLNMADGCLLLVDAAEGVLSQTRYVLSLALKIGLTPIVIINKIDRKDQRTSQVLEEINDLFLDLVTKEEQLNFPVLYAIGRQGIVGNKTKLNPNNSLKLIDSNNLEPLFKKIISTIPSPTIKINKGFQLQAITLDHDNHKGTLVIGKVSRGQIKINDPLAVIRNSKKISQGRVEHLSTFKGLKQISIKKTQLGDIVSIAGFNQIKIGDTLTSLEHPDGLPSLKIAEPTIQIQISPSNSPLVGQDGKFNTSRQLKQRLEKELKTNVSLRLSKGSTSEKFIVAGRGELHLSILIETMRREGYEFSVARPEVIFKTINSQIMEPWENLIIEVPETKTGIIISSLSNRKGSMTNLQNLKIGTRLTYKISTKNLIGLRSELMTKTSGTAIISSQFDKYQPKTKPMDIQKNGSLIATESGQALAYSIEHIQQRGSTFIEPGEQVYQGMIVGQNSRSNDLWINICKGKKLTNMRAASADDALKIAPAVKLSLEQCLNFLATDELLEVTPKHLRLRKKILTKK
ncbi:MAG: translational GTPase TypA [Patescibacteria group bacterium]|nr:translational GTPase TypA [Patescibacteria group bacterium]